jgi:hypothetical protein
MLKISGLLAGALLLSIGSLSASAMPTNGARIVQPATAITLAQYGGEQCFNRCVAGRVFRRCQLEHDRNVVSCCSTRCNWY